MMKETSDKSDKLTYDPVFLHARREALLILSVWFVCLIWSISVCYLNGYHTNIDPDRLPTVWGIPSWVFWGIFFPWGAADVFTVWFCFFYMRDDDLAAAAREIAMAESSPLQDSSKQENS